MQAVVRRGCTIALFDSGQGSWQMKILKGEACLLISRWRAGWKGWRICYLCTAGAAFDSNASACVSANEADSLYPGRRVRWMELVMALWIWAERARHQGVSLCLSPSTSPCSTLRFPFIFCALTFDWSIWSALSDVRCPESSINQHVHLGSLRIHL